MSDGGFSRAAVVLVLVLMPLATSKYPIGGAFTADRFQLPKLTIVTLLSVMGLLAWVFSVARRGGSIRTHPSLWVLMGLLGWYGVSSIPSIDWRTSLGGSARWEGVFTLLLYAAWTFLVMQLATSPARQRALLAFAVVGGATVGTYAIVQHLGLDPVEWNMAEEGASRVFATYGNPDFLGGYLVFPFIAAVGLAFDEGIAAARRWAYASAGAVMAVALALTRVRGAWIGAVAGAMLLVCAILLIRRGVKKAEWAALAVAVVLVIGTVTAAGAGSAIVAKITSFEGGGGLLSGRIEIWRVTALAVKASPLTGHGPDTLQWAYGRYRDQRAVMALGHEFVADAAHNHPLQLAATIGIPGALLFLAFGAWALASGVRTAFRGAGQSDARFVIAIMSSAFLATAVYLLSGIALPGIMPFFWFGAACCLAPSAKVRHAAASQQAVLVQAVASVLAIVVMSGMARVVWADHLARVGMSSADPVAGVVALESARELNPLRVGYDIDLGKVGHAAMRTQALAGNVAGAQAQFASAEAVLRTHTERVPWDPAGHAELSYLYNDADTLGLADTRTRADSVAALGLERFPYNMDLLKQRAAALFNAGSAADAEPLIDAAVRLDAKDVDVLLMRAQLYDATDRPDEARAWFRKVLLIEPENAVARAAVDGSGAE